MGAGGALRARAVWQRNLCVSGGNSRGEAAAQTSQRMCGAVSQSIDERLNGEGGSTPPSSAPSNRAIAQAVLSGAVAMTFLCNIDDTIFKSMQARANIWPSQLLIASHVLLFLCFVCSHPLTPIPTPFTRHVTMCIFLSPLPCRANCSSQSPLFLPTYHLLFVPSFTCSVFLTFF